MSHTHFSRIFDRMQVNKCISMLNAMPEVNPKFDLITADAETFRICAPDGDVVFSGLRHLSGKYICLLHREVFDEGVAA